MKSYYLIFIATLAISVSCTNQQSDVAISHETDLSYLIMSKSEYISLKPNEQVDFWLSRLEYTLNLSSTQNEIVEKMIKDIKSQSLKDFKLTINLKELGVGAVSNFSQNDFLTVFCSVDRVPEINNIGGICDQCLIDLQKNEAQSDDSSTEDKKDKLDCNCKWTCGSYLSGPIAYSHTDCKGVKGCGFFGLGTCTGRDELDSANCN
jgi:hypothetical protein